MGSGVGAQVGLGDDDDIQRLWELFMEQLCLVDIGLDVPLHRGLFEVLCGEVVVIDLGAILAMGTSPRIGTGRGEVQGRIAPQLGNEVHAALARHLQGVVVAKVPIQHEVGQGDHTSDQVQQGVEPAGNTHQLRRESPVGLGCVLAPLGTPRPRCAPRTLRFLAAALALLAAFSASLRTTCSTRIGNECRCWRLTKDNTKKASPGTGLPYRLAKNRSRPWVCWPALVATTSSPTSR